MELYQLLNQAKKISLDENSNKIILSHVLKKDLAWIYANQNLIITDDKILNTYLSLVEMFASGFPLAYILGYTFFNDTKIFVDQNVLIPRSETALLVQKVLFYTQKMFGSEGSLDVLDLATGSACIAVSLALAKPQWSIIATDVSSDALSLASYNKEFHHLENISLIQSDLFSSLDHQFDVLISNPPYIDQNDSSSYDSNRLQYEPALALFAQNFGLEFYQKIFASILNFTKDKFLIALEIGFDQKEKLEEILKQDFSNYCYWFEKDHQNHFRFLFISSEAL